MMDKDASTTLVAGKMTNSMVMEKLNTRMDICTKASGKRANSAVKGLSVQRTTQFTRDSSTMAKGGARDPTTIQLDLVMKEIISKEKDTAKGK